MGAIEGSADAVAFPSGAPQASKVIENRSFGAHEEQGEVAVLVDDLVLGQFFVLAVPDGHAHPSAVMRLMT
ncbi:hypothetical protein GCM10009535_54120 [Streptomyces thermocarboxydovorans]|uniref:Uncharacterized protein n=1 Tax=Streptomyces thermocarboxydovorans TaxID=59298 RepID=A0ABP3SWS5_9ACTN